MNARRIAVWCLGAWSVGGSAYATHQDQGRPELHVYLMDGVGVGEELIKGVRAEVESIYALAGVRIVWLEATSVPLKRYEARAYLLDELVLPLPPRDRASLSKWSEPMGVAFGGPSAHAATIYVSHRAVLARVGFRRRIARKHLARALGRALAHELAHRFLGAAHTREGILAPILAERDLIDGDRSALFFTAGQARLLRAGAKAEDRGLVAAMPDDHASSLPRRHD